MGTVIRVSDLKNPAYLALRLTPGARVSYHGSLVSSHGTWTVQPCQCRWCLRDVCHGRPASRYELCSLNGERTGPIHVRHTSVTPLPGEVELNKAGTWIATKYTAAYLRKALRRAFPGVKFSVRTVSRKNTNEISVSWTGGPTRTAVGTLAAPLLATYGTPDRCGAKPITVTVAGTTHSGVPMVDRLHLNRD